MHPTRRTLLTRATALAALSACGARLDTFPFDGASAPLPFGPTDLRVTFFSVGCFHVRWGDLGFLTDPFFTHVSLWRAGFGHVVPDPAEVASYLPRFADVRAVLIGHAHYDHCLGLPTVAAHLHPEAALLGSATAAHTFAPLELPRRWEVVNDRLATVDAPGRWISLAGGRLRVLPILSGHPDNVSGIHVFRGALTEDREDPPTRAWHYQEGVTIAYLVDFREPDGTIRHRAYVQTSSTGPPVGRVPQAIFDARRVDTALLAMDCATHRASGLPSILDHIDPVQVLFCHWGDFFRAKDAVRREGVKVDLPWARETLHREANGSRYLFPGWGSEFVFQGDV